MNGSTTRAFKAKKSTLMELEAQAQKVSGSFFLFISFILSPAFPLHVYYVNDVYFRKNSLPSGGSILFM
jgi:hypothetical protein